MSLLITCNCKTSATLLPLLDIFPGPAWFECFKRDASNMTFPSDTKVDDMMNEVLSIGDWAQEMQTYLLQNAENKLLDDLAKVFVMEYESFLLDTVPKEKVSVVVSCRLFLGRHLNDGCLNKIIGLVPRVVHFQWTKGWKGVRDSSLAVCKGVRHERGLGMSEVYSMTKPILTQQMIS